MPLPSAAMVFLHVALHGPIPPDISSGLELARFRRTATEGKISHLQGSMANFKGDPRVMPSHRRSTRPTPSSVPPPPIDFQDQLVSYKKYPAILRLRLGCATLVVRSPALVLGLIYTSRQFSGSRLEVDAKKTHTAGFQPFG